MFFVKINVTGDLKSLKKNIVTNSHQTILLYY